jgi:hypothetical protein
VGLFSLIDRVLNQQSVSVDRVFRGGLPATKNCISIVAGANFRSHHSPMIRIFLLFLRRLWLPMVFFLGFSLICVLVYRRLEGLRRRDCFSGSSILRD